jgi:hypothetical protein
LFSEFKKKLGDRKQFSGRIRRLRRAEGVVVILYQRCRAEMNKLIFEEAVPNGLR